MLCMEDYTDGCKEKSNFGTRSRLCAKTWNQVKKDAQKVLDEFNCKPTELPLIFVTDPAIIGLGVKPGDMIKISRKSGTAGESIYYRYVVET